jgi:hypothetical protein
MCSEWQGAPEKNLVQLHCKKRKKGVQTSRKKMSVNHVLTVDHQLLSINHQWLSGGGERSTEQHKPSICCRPGCSLIHSPKTACLKKKKKGGGLVANQITNIRNPPVRHYPGRSPHQWSARPQTLGCRTPLQPSTQVG